MRKVLLYAAFGIASCLGMHSATQGVEPAPSLSATGMTEQTPAGRRQYFGPYSEAEARQHLRNYLRNTHYNCGLSRTLRGWWVWVDFPG